MSINLKCVCLCFIFSFFLCYSIKMIFFFYLLAHYFDSIVVAIAIIIFFSIVKHGYYNIWKKKFLFRFCFHLVLTINKRKSIIYHITVSIIKGKFYQIIIKEKLILSLNHMCASHERFCFFISNTTNFLIYIKKNLPIKINKKERFID